MDFPGHIGKKISIPIERIKIYTNPNLVNMSKSTKLAKKKIEWVVRTTKKGK